MRRRIHAAWSEGIDLVPLIDCVFLILLFFILCGRLTTDQHSDQVSVPPGRTAQAIRPAPERVVLSLRTGEPPALSFGGSGEWISVAGGWTPVRERLDRIWDRSGKRTEGGRTVSEAVLEVRADARLPYRVVQELQQIAADAVDPGTLAPRVPGAAAQRTFASVDFAAVPPG